MATTISEKSFSQAIAERRATQSFDSTAIPHEHLKQILQAGLEAPSGYNLQPWRFVVVRDPEQRIGRPLDPLRFRANLYVEGWPAWAENDWEGRGLRLGEAEARVFKPIVRCAAPGVDPATAIRDLDIPAELHRLYGHMHCGIYVQVTKAGAVREGDEATLPSEGRVVA